MNKEERLSDLNRELSALNDLADELGTVIRQRLASHRLMRPIEVDYLQNDLQIAMEDEFLVEACKGHAQIRDRIDEVRELIEQVKADSQAA